MLKKTPGFSALTILVISVGLGLAIYMFAIVNLLAYKDLDISHYDRLMVIDAVIDGFEQNGGSIYAHDYEYMKAKQQSFDKFSAYVNASVTLSDGNTAARYDAVMMEPEAFNLFDGQISIAQGRTFTENDSYEGSEAVAIISHRLWQDYFNGDSDIVGKTTQLDGKPTKIIAVMQEGYAYPMNQDVWQPLTMPKNQKAGQGWRITILGQLKEGTSLERAQAELSTYAKEIAQLYPESNGTIGVNVRTPVKMMMDNSMPIIYMMVGATLFVLILVVANVANLMLARASERSKEFAIRTALGAPKYRIVRQMLIETLIICLIGGVFGVLIAGWGLDVTRPIFHNMGGWLAPWWTFTLGSEELIAALWIVLGTAILIALFPVAKSSDSDVNQVLRDGTRGALGKKAGKLSRLLIGGEIFLSCAVLIVAGALIIGVNSAIEADYGSDTKGFLTAQFALDNDQYSNQESRYQYQQRLINALNQQPGVIAATVGSALPGRASGREPIKVEGLEATQGVSNRSLFISAHSTYFSVLNIPLLEGREFDNRDTDESQQVVIVSSTFAKKYFPNESAIGKRIKIRPNDDKRKWRTIIGVVDHVVHQQPFGNAYTMPAVYVPSSQLAYTWHNVAIKVQGDPYQYQKMLKEVAGKLDANIPMFEVISFEDKLYRRVMGIQFVGHLFIVFGVLALLLASAGIFGVMSQNVTRRTQEFGVRRALGATDSNIYKLLAKQSAWLLLFGGVTGAAVGFFGVKVISGNLMALSGYFPVVCLIVSSVIIATTIIATLIPAKKTLSVEPNHALRYE